MSERQTLVDSARYYGAHDRDLRSPQGLCESLLRSLTSAQGSLEQARVADLDPDLQIAILGSARSDLQSVAMNLTTLCADVADLKARAEVVNSIAVRFGEQEVEQ